MYSTCVKVDLDGENNDQQDKGRRLNYCEMHGWRGERLSSYVNGRGMRRWTEEQKRRLVSS